VGKAFRECGTAERGEVFVEKRGRDRALGSARKSRGLRKGRGDLKRRASLDQAKEGRKSRSRLTGRVSRKPRSKKGGELPER